MEDGKPFPFDALTRSQLEWSCHCLTPVFVFNVQRSVPHFVFSRPRYAARVSLLPCQTFLNSVSLRPRFLDRDLKRGFQLRGHCSDAHPAQARRQFHSVQSSSSSDLSISFSQMPFVLASSVSARGFIFLEFTQGSRCRLRGHEPQCLGLPRIQAPSIAEAAPTREEATLLRLNTKVTVSTQKKSHLGSSDLAADGTVYFNGQHEDTTCINHNPQTTA